MRITRTSAALSAPAHLALIPDGNRRWARTHGMSLLDGYQNGVKKFVSFSIWAKGFGVKTLTVWALSTENVKNRSGAELAVLFNLYYRAAKDPEMLAMLIKNKARIKIIGNLAMIPKNVRGALMKLERRTAEYKEFTINLLIGYGGREDIIYGLRQQYNNRKVSENTFAKSIRTSSIPDVDLIIRTSGERRLSGLLPWQTNYSELYFARKHWPEFNKTDLKRALVAFSERERRFGR